MHHVASFTRAAGVLRSRGTSTLLRKTAAERALQRATTFNFLRRGSGGSPDLSNIKVAVVGGSLGGLAAANVFSRLGASVTVFERSPASLEKRGACLGFVDVNLWEKIRGKRMTWPNGKSVTRGESATNRSCLLMRVLLLS